MAMILRDAVHFRAKSAETIYLPVQIHHSNLIHSAARQKQPPI